MSSSESRDGVVYTETIVHAPPEQYASEAPYQLAIIDLDCGQRVTVRVLGRAVEDWARIGERVVFAEERDGVSYYRKASAPGVDMGEDVARPMV